MRASTLVLMACALAVGVLGDHDMKGKHKEFMEKCLKEAGLEKEDLRKARKDEEEPDRKMKCFEACISKEKGFLVDGKPNKDKMLEMLPPDVPDREQKVEAITKCSEQTGSDDCETAYQVMKCLHDNKVFPPPRHRHHHHRRHSV